jgi:hypothetical protein
MKVTKEMKDKVDINGFIVDFIYCSECYNFTSLKGYEIGDDVTCQYCKKDENILRQ